MKHKTPNNNLSDYSEIYKKFIINLSGKMNLNYYGKDFSPFPLMIKSSINDEIKKIHDVLIKAIKSIVENYFIDEEIQKILPLTSKQKKLIKLSTHKPYHLFSIRPDFLFSESGDIKLCEVNARFTFNGFISTYYLNQQLTEDYAGILKFEDELMEIVDNYLSKFDLAKPIFILRDKEKGYDINTLKSYLRYKNVNVIDIKPSELYLKGNSLKGKGVDCEQLIMELHQSELDNLDPRIAENIILNVNYVNDIRTIMIVHDKRLFVCLSDFEIMSRYLNEQDTLYLLQHIIPTYLIDNVKNEILKNKSNWVLKKCLSGKGDGMYIGSETPISDIKHVISVMNDLYVVQPYLTQKKIDIFFNNEYTPCRSVGMILSLNGLYQGTGYFRTSPDRIVALSRGGYAVAACFM
ncbi:hypothetical protein [Vibrio sagamiensis]|uniref:Glutathionylspermidine synthase pre-ATP-grasp-like domain-containing protein n=1 Tax=Vibrio sagamiensis NBRC 104589 TaxID=1219064 RepID=A0A511QIC5_9VIBR|nr:hypothetical protein [Vibrio sagamiensis]GEM77064.1 hypothetical protein VSA01S_31760 [Vibrio sagamiensis NBRC 104589]